MKNDGNKNTEKISGYDLCLFVLEENENKVIDLIDLASGMETDWLEFKAACGPPEDDSSGNKLNKNDYRWHVAEAVIALANTHGGCVLLGVNDEAEPVGLDASDPRKLRNKKDDDAFLRYLEQAVLRPQKGWGCAAKGRVKVYPDCPHDLFELRMGKLAGKDVVIILVPPRSETEICESCNQPTLHQCIHCIEEPNGHIREYVPVRALGGLGNVRRLYRSKEWCELEKNREIKHSHYFDLFQKFVEHFESGMFSLKGSWYGSYKEKGQEWPFKLTVKDEHFERGSQGMHLRFSGTAFEPSLDRKWAGKDIDNLHAQIEGTFNVKEKKITFQKTYEGLHHHSFKYEGFFENTKPLTETFEGTWRTKRPFTLRPIKALRRFFNPERGGSFLFQKNDDIFKVLITCFGPFGGNEINTSELVLDQINRLRTEAEIFKLKFAKLPVEHQKAREEMENLLKKEKPDACLCLGMYFSDNGCKIETEARLPKEFSQDSPKVLKGFWPFEDMLNSLSSAGVKSELSRKAGQFVCESTYWALLKFRHVKKYPQYAAFLHIPHDIDSAMAKKITIGIIEPLEKLAVIDAV